MVQQIPNSVKERVKTLNLQEISSGDTEWDIAVDIYLEYNGSVADYSWIRKLINEYRRPKGVVA